MPDERPTYLQSAARRRLLTFDEVRRRREFADRNVYAVRLLIQSAKVDRHGHANLYDPALVAKISDRLAVKRRGRPDPELLEGEEWWTPGRIVEALRERGVHYDEASVVRLLTRPGVKVPRRKKAAEFASLRACEWLERPLPLHLAARLPETPGL